MTFTELMPALHELDNADKLKALQFLEQELDSENKNGHSTPTAGPPILGDTNASAKAIEFYKTELQPILEPEYNGQHVAIDAESKSYEVARGSGQARRALRARQPNAFIVTINIGPPDMGLVARMRGEMPR